MSQTNLEEMMQYVQNGNLEAVRCCLLNDKVDPNGYVSFQDSRIIEFVQPLTFALEQRNYEMVKLLLEWEANPNLVLVKTRHESCEGFAGKTDYGCFESLMSSIIKWIGTYSSNSHCVFATKAIWHQHILDFFQKMFDLLIVFGFDRFAFDHIRYNSPIFGWSYTPFLGEHVELSNVIQRFLTNLPNRVKKEQVEVQKEISDLSFQYKSTLLSFFLS
jgi:hypothetical protein